MYTFLAWGSKHCVPVCVFLSLFQMVPGGGAVPTMQRIPLPGAEMLEEEPLYVNAKQYHRILKRRQARAKLEAEGKIPKERRVSLFFQPFHIKGHIENFRIGCLKTWSRACMVKYNERQVRKCALLFVMMKWPSNQHWYGGGPTLIHNVKLAVIQLRFPMMSILISWTNRSSNQILLSLFWCLSD